MAEPSAAALDEKTIKTNAGEGGGSPQKPEIEKESDIPVRRSVASEIIARKNRTIDRLRSKVNDGAEEGDGEPPTEVDEGNEELTPEARSAVGREVDRRISPIVQTLASKIDEDELQDLLRENPDAKPFEQNIRAYMADSHYSGVPAEVIYHHLTYGKTREEGDKKRKAADMEARQMGSGGSSFREEPSSGGLPSAGDIADMDEKDFDKLQDDVRRGKFAVPKE